MDAGKTGYLLLDIFIVRGQCALYGAIMWFLTVIENALNAALDLVANTLETICNTLSNIPVVGWFFRVICIAVTWTLVALFSMFGGIVALSFNIIIRVFELLFWLTVGFGMVGAWSLHWAISRYFNFKRCVGQPESIQKTVTVHLKILMHAPDTRNISDEQLNLFEQRTLNHFEQCGVDIKFTRSFVVVRDNYTIKVGKWFVLQPAAFFWFTCQSKMFEPTVFFVDSFESSTLRGRTVPVLTSFVMISKEKSVPTTLAHELGHLSDIWPHASNETRIMFAPVIEGTSVDFVRPEICLIRTSRFVRWLQRASSNSIWTSPS